jgi:hypothetical protein
VLGTSSPTAITSAAAHASASTARTIARRRALPGQRRGKQTWQGSFLVVGEAGPDGG